LRALGAMGRDDATSRADLSWIASAIDGVVRAPTSKAIASTVSMEMTIFRVRARALVDRVAEKQFRPMQRGDRGPATIVPPDVFGVVAVEIELS
jgi:hypothetical protein